MGKEDENKPLNKKQSLFVDNYFVHNLNGTEAYMKTYNPKGGRDVARANASELLAKPNIAKAVQERLSEHHMSADEALKLLTDIARGDIGELMDTTSMGFEINMDDAKKRGLSKLVKKIKNRTEITSSKNGDGDREVHTQEIELYSAHEAIRDILKVTGKIKDTNITINVSLTDD